MDKWFKLADEWYHKSGFVWDPKRNWQKFVSKIKEVWDIKDEKIKWKLLDFEQTRRRLLGIPDGKGNYIMFEDCFEIHLMTEKEINHYKEITGKLYDKK